MDALPLALRLLLVLAFLASGAMKLIGGERARAGWSRYRLPSWFRSVTGLIEVIAAVGLVAGLWIPGLTLAATALIAVTMIGAIYSHAVREGDGVGRVLPAAILLVLAGTVAAGI